MEKISLQPIIKELDNVFEMLNHEFYKGELEKPIITVSPANSKGILGWCTTDRRWKDENNDETGYYEINVCSEVINRSFTDICETILHEMAHLKNSIEKIKDCSGYYHNKQFKATAEKHGLTVEKTRYGWSKTSLNERAKEFIVSLDQTKFTIYRKEKVSGKAANKSNSIKHQCPECGAVARTTKEYPLFCGICGIQMNMER